MELNIGTWRQPEDLEPPVFSSIYNVDPQHHETPKNDPPPPPRETKTGGFDMKNMGGILSALMSNQNGLDINSVLGLLGGLNGGTAGGTPNNANNKYSLLTSVLPLLLNGGLNGGLGNLFGANKKPAPFSGTDTINLDDYRRVR